MKAVNLMNPFQGHQEVLEEKTQVPEEGVTVI
jgi:hypothetical protein